MLTLTLLLLVGALVASILSLLGKAPAGVAPLLLAALLHYIPVG